MREPADLFSTPEAILELTRRWGAAPSWQHFDAVLDDIAQWMLRTTPVHPIGGPQLLAQRHRDLLTDGYADGAIRTFTLVDG